MSTSERLAFGELLRRYRLAAGMTQEMLAQQAGLTARGVHDLEQGLPRQTPNAETAHRLADALDLSETDRATLQSSARQPAENERAIASALPTSVVTFLLTDVEGSTRLWQHYRDRMGSVLARHDELIEQLVAEHDGALVRPRGEGDSRFAVFARASDAVAAACAIQIALIHEPWALPEPLRVRVGVHTGESELRLGDYYGPAVNHCARLRASAHGGQVVVSTVTADLVREALAVELTLRDLGEHRLKDLERPEHIWQVVHPELPADFPPLLSLVTLPNNLTVQATSLIGREDELADIQRRLLEPGVRLVTLTGPGGVGKTRVALQVATNVLERFADGVFAVSLAALSEAAMVVPTIAQILGVREQGGGSLQVTLENFLRDKSMLLVLDNFEQVLPAAVSVAELLRACPRLRVLVTSRALLRVYGEQEIAIPPLQQPGPPWPAPERLIQYDAVRLFVERARAVLPDFGLTDATAPTIAAICARLDGLPLAIELAAARLNLLTPDAMLARLNQRLDLLVGGPRDVPSRQQTLSGTIQWSYDLLDAREQALFQRQGVFVGGWTLEAAEQVCTGAGELSGEVLNTLGALVDQSLVYPDLHAPGEPRFDMLESIREFALKELIASGEADEIRTKHVDYLIMLGERAAPELNAGPEHVRWITRLDPERHNLRAALRWCVENDDVERGLRLGGSVWRYWFLRGSLSDARDWLQGLLRLLRDASRTSPTARALNAAGVLAIQVGDYARAQVLHQRGLEIGRELNDHEQIGASLHNLGRLAMRDGDSDLAQRLLQEAVTHAQAAANRRREAVSLTVLGGVMAERGDYETACARYAESVAVYRELGDNTGMAQSRSRQGFTLLAGGGDVVTAQALCEEGLQLARAAGHASTLAWSHLDLALVRLEQADYAGARALFVEALSPRDDSSDTGARVSLALQGIASVAAATGQHERALRVFGSAAAFRASREPVYSGPGMGLHRIWAEHWQARASSAFGEAGAAEALSAGSALPIDDAIAYALAQS